MPILLKIVETKANQCHSFLRASVTFETQTFHKLPRLSHPFFLFLQDLLFPVQFQTV